MKEIKYSAGMVNKLFWYLEFKKTAKLYNEGKSQSEIKNIVMNDNIYQAPTAYRANHIFISIIKRLKSLDDILIYLVVNSDSATAKAVAVASVMKTDLLFFEFMYEVFREKIILGDNLITDKDLNKFFSIKKTQSEIVDKWTDYTIEKLVRCYTRVLYEAAFIDNSNDKRLIIKPILSYELQDHLKMNGMAKYLYVMTGEK